MSRADALLTDICEWLAAHPRLTCFAICTLCLMAGALEEPF